MGLDGAGAISRGGLHCMNCTWGGLGYLFASLDVLLTYLTSVA